MADLKVTYTDVEISYVEDTNRWQFTLRGRERSAESLAKAKEAIDKPEPQKKAAPFERIKVWTNSGYSDSWRQGEVTSIAERQYSRQEVWVSIDGRRVKIAARQCFPDTPETIAAIEALRANEAEQARLGKLANEIRYTMKPIELPKED